MKNENVIEKRIMNTFVAMSSSMPIEKIKVTSLCRQCGIRRQTFYNHFNDIDSLIEAIFERNGRRIFETAEPSKTWQDDMYNILVSMKKNKTFVTAVYQGVEHDQMEMRMMHQIQMLVKKIVDDFSKGRNITEEEKDAIAEYHQTAISGIIIRWIKFGMKIDPRTIVSNIYMIANGSIEEAVDRYDKQHKKELLNRVDRTAKMSI